MKKKPNSRKFFLDGMKLASQKNELALVPNDKQNKLIKKLKAHK